MKLQMTKLFIYWILIAILPTFILFLTLIIFYPPLNGFGQYFFARGKLLENKIDRGLMTFEQSSTFWDTSDIAPIGSDLELLKINNQPNIHLRERIIIRGTRVGHLGQIDNVTIYRDHFQPWGVDWKVGLALVFGILSLVSLIAYKRLSKK